MIVQDDKVLLTGNEIATAIDAYLATHRISVTGPRAIRIIVDGGEERFARDVTSIVYVDPPGILVDNR